MEQYIMKGGNPLVGEVIISGAKNAALAILAASIMTDEDVLIENLPDVRDINVLLEAIEEIGADVDRLDRHTVRINARNIKEVSVDDEYIRKIRASYYFIGALLGKYKSAEVPLPGGCNIGSRPIDQHLKGFRALGAKIEVEKGAVVAHAIDLVGSHIYLDVVSVGATINIMMAATLAEGETIIENPAKEPHVVDVANFLNSMGANIKGAGTDVIRIKGVHILYQASPAAVIYGNHSYRHNVGVRNFIAGSACAWRHHILLGFSCCSSGGCFFLFFSGRCTGCQGYCHQDGHNTNQPFFHNCKASLNNPLKSF